MKHIIGDPKWVAQYQINQNELTQMMKLISINLFCPNTMADSQGNLLVCDQYVDGGFYYAIPKALVPVPNKAYFCPNPDMHCADLDFTESNRPTLEFAKEYTHLLHELINAIPLYDEENV